MPFYLTLRSMKLETLESLLHVLFFFFWSHVLCATRMVCLLWWYRVCINSMLTQIWLFIRLMKNQPTNNSLEDCFTTNLPRELFIGTGTAATIMAILLQFFVSPPNVEYIFIPTTPFDIPSGWPILYLFDWFFFISIFRIELFYVFDTYNHVLFDILHIFR